MPDLTRAERVAHAVALRVAEIPYRDSPADQPEMMLVTRDELIAFIVAEMPPDPQPQTGALRELLREGVELVRYPDSVELMATQLAWKDRVRKLLATLDPTDTTRDATAHVAGDQPRARTTDGTHSTESDSQVLRLRTPASTPPGRKQADRRLGSQDGGAPATERGDERGAAQDVGGEGLLCAREAVAGEVWIINLADAATDARSWEREFDALAMALGGRLTCDEARGSEDLAQWEKRCRAAHLSELGHLMFTAPTRYHAQIAERVAGQRLAEVPNPFAKKETPDA